jgi:hypothetical protein
LDATDSNRNRLENYRRGTDGIDDHWDARGEADRGGRQTAWGVAHPGAAVEGHPDRAHGCPEDDERTDQQAAPSRHRQNHSTRRFCCRAPEGCTGPHCPAIPPRLIHPCTQPLSQPSMTAVWASECGNGAGKPCDLPPSYPPSHPPSHPPCYEPYLSIPPPYIPPITPPITPPISRVPAGVFSSATNLTSRFLHPTIHLAAHLTAHAISRVPAGVLPG